jgi:hypothetical protein
MVCVASRARNKYKKLMRILGGADGAALGYAICKQSLVAIAPIKDFLNLIPWFLNCFAGLFAMQPNRHIPEGGQGSFQMLNDLLLQHCG